MNTTNTLLKIINVNIYLIIELKSQCLVSTNTQEKQNHK